VAAQDVGQVHVGAELDLLADVAVAKGTVTKKVRKGRNAIVPSDCTAMKPPPRVPFTRVPSMGMRKSRPMDAAKGVTRTLLSSVVVEIVARPVCPSASAEASAANPIQVASLNGAQRRWVASGATVSVSTSTTWDGLAEQRAS
jgi:hypothetical protein